MTLVLGLAALACLAIAALLVYHSLASRKVSAALVLARESKPADPRVGRLCLVNTPQPDDQTLRGVVREVYPDGALLLGAAAHLAGDGTALAAGDVYVPAASWVQIGVSADEDGRRDGEA